MIVEFEREVYRVSEDVGSVSVCAVLRGDSAGEVIRITLVTQDQTAQGSIIKAVQHILSLLPHS